MLAAMQKTTRAASKVSLVRFFCSCKVLHQIIKKQIKSHGRLEISAELAKFFTNHGEKKIRSERHEFCQTLQSSSSNHQFVFSNLQGFNSAVAK
jgi:hypothetical protein